VSEAEVTLRVYEIHQAFLADLITALASMAWPLVALVAVVLLRGEITGLLRGVRKLKAGGTEVEFASTLDDAMRAAAGVESDRASGMQERVGELEAHYARARQLARSSPRGAVVEAWIPIEGLVSELAARHGNGDHVRNRAQSLRNALRDSGPAGESTLALYDELRQLRNEAVHAGVTPDTVQAVRFVDAAMGLALRLVSQATLARDQSVSPAGAPEDEPR
jgi:hypothetical protein